MLATASIVAATRLTQLSTCALVGACRPANNDPAACGYGEDALGAASLFAYCDRALVIPTSRRAQGTLVYDACAPVLCDSTTANGAYFLAVALQPSWIVTDADALWSSRASEPIVCLATSNAALACWPLRALEPSMTVSGIAHLPVASNATRSRAPKPTMDEEAVVAAVLLGSFAILIAAIMLAVALCGAPRRRTSVPSNGDASAPLMEAVPISIESGVHVAGYVPGLPSSY